MEELCLYFAAKYFMRNFSTSQEKEETSGGGAQQSIMRYL